MAAEKLSDAVTRELDRIKECAACVVPPVKVTIYENAEGKTMVRCRKGDVPVETCRFVGSLVWEVRV